MGRGLKMRLVQFSPANKQSFISQRYFKGHPPPHALVGMVAPRRDLGMPLCHLTQPVPAVQGVRCLPKASPPERRQGPLSQLPNSAAGLWWPRRPFAGLCHQPGTATALRQRRASRPGQRCQRNGHQTHTSALGMILIMGAQPSTRTSAPLVGLTD